jgi:hypothetical protein
MPKRFKDDKCYKLYFYLTAIMQCCRGNSNKFLDFFFFLTIIDLRVGWLRLLRQQCEIFMG